MTEHYEVAVVGSGPAAAWSRPSWPTVAAGCC